VIRHNELQGPNESANNILMGHYLSTKPINIFSGEKFHVWSGLEPATSATPPGYQRISPRSQITILKKNGSLDSGIQAWYHRQLQGLPRGLTPPLLADLQGTICQLPSTSPRDRWTVLVTVGIISEIDQACHAACVRPMRKIHLLQRSV
jgi:hypothetical protein